VFYYRSPNPRTLARLSRFFEVPIEGIRADFAEGLTAAEVCARSVQALYDRGVRNVYVSNLSPERAPKDLAAIHGALGLGAVRLTG